LNDLVVERDNLQILVGAVFLEAVELCVGIRAFD
jgi:hypothetical protein